MPYKLRPKLDHRKRYLQIALNSTLDEAYNIINALPVSDRIIIEAGTPLIKKYGEAGIKQIHQWYEQHLAGPGLNFRLPASSTNSLLSLISPAVAALAGQFKKTGQADYKKESKGAIFPYIVADLKTMDRGGTEVAMAARAGASAAVALGAAPIETLDFFIRECEQNNLDPMIDMMNVEFPLNVLRALKKIPPVVILHRGVDEEQFNRQKQIPLHEIRRVKGNYDIMISIAGGDTLREVQRSIFNDADIVVVWKSVYQKTSETAGLVEGFLKEIK